MIPVKPVEVRHIAQMTRSLAAKMRILTLASASANSLMSMQMMETPLSRAAHNGHLHSVIYLTEQGADVNCLDLVSTCP